MSQRGGNAGGFLAGFLVGGLAGLAVGLLWSSDREKVMENLPGLGSEVIDRATKEVKARLENAREAFQQGTAETRDRMGAELGEARRPE